MIDLNALCTRAHAHAKKAGFLEAPRAWDEVTNLFHTELAEATEEYRNHRLEDETYYEVKYYVSDPSQGKGSTELKATASEEGLAAFRRDSSVVIKEAKPCGILTELADVIIRIGQHCGTEKLPLEEKYNEVMGMTISISKSLQEVIARCHALVGQAYVASSDPTFLMAMVIYTIVLYCDVHKLPLEEAIERKLTFNETRPYKHGGKKI